MSVVQVWNRKCQSDVIPGLKSVWQVSNSLEQIQARVSLIECSSKMVQDQLVQLKSADEQKSESIDEASMHTPEHVEPPKQQVASVSKRTHQANISDRTHEFIDRITSR